MCNKGTGYSPPAMGTVVVSVDAELGWGFHDQDHPPTDRLRGARDGWRTLLALCDEYGIEATWAVVGHLLLEDCQGRHVEHPAPDGWFAHERGDDALAPELRYAPDLIDAIQDAAVDHEIGLHTFSHVEFGDPTTTRRLARAEVAVSLELARDAGIEMESFVFPRNNVGHREALAAYGIDCYRGVAPHGDGLTSWNSRVGKLLRATVLRRPPPLVDPTIDSYGLVTIPASLHLFSFEGLPRSLVELVAGDPVVRQAKLGIDAAVEEDGVFHLWLHPNSLTTTRDTERVRRVFEYLDERRSETTLTVETMAAVADQTRADADQTETDPVEGL